MRSGSILAISAAPARTGPASNRSCSRRPSLSKSCLRCGRRIPPVSPSSPQKSRRCPGWPALRIDSYEATSTLSTGIIATAIVLIIGYVIVSRLVGLAFRLVVPLVLLVILGGAGVFSGLLPVRPPADPYAPYGQAQHRSGADIGDLRLRDIAEMAVDTIRSVLQGSLALLNGVSEPEPRREPRWLEEPQRMRRDEPYEDSPDFADDPRRGEPRRGW